jgi:hypothetical protein
MTNITERYPEEDLSTPDPEDKWDYAEDDGTMPANVEVLREAVVGHRIVAVDEEEAIPREYSYWGRQVGLRLTLDDGRQVWLADTSDCCAFTELKGVIKHLDQIDHIITGVGTEDGFTKWHIYADLGDVLELQVEWSCGNPFYYGYGFDIVVRDA